MKQTRSMAKDMLNKPSKWTDPQIALKSTNCLVLQLQDYQSVATALQEHGFSTSSYSIEEDQAAKDSHIPMVIASLLTFLAPDQHTSVSTESVVNDERNETGSLPNLQLIKLCPDEETNQSVSAYLVCLRTLFLCSSTAISRSLRKLEFYNCMNCFPKLKFCLSGILFL